MSNYFDNQKSWNWNISPGKSVLVTTDHGDHTHTLDLTNVSVEDMVNNGGKTMGDIHRSVSHDKKEEMMDQKGTMEDRAREFRESLMVKGVDAPKVNETLNEIRASLNEGGRELGDDGPGGHGRSPEAKGAECEGEYFGDLGRGNQSSEGQGSSSKDSGGQYSVDQGMDGHTSEGQGSSSKDSGGQYSVDQGMDGHTSEGQDDGGQGCEGQDSGGQDSGGQDSGGQDSGGQDSGGQDSGGQDSGGQDSGGQDSGGQDSGGQSVGGH